MAARLPFSRRFGRSALFGLAGVSLLASLACFEIVEQLTVKPDLSGTAVLKMTVDFEPMVYVVAAMQENTGQEPGAKPKAPSAKAVAKAKAEISKKNQSEMKGKEAETREKLSAALPEGITLKAFKLTGKGLKVTQTLTLAFDHVAKLRDLDFSATEAKETPVKNPLVKPFAGLEVLEEGDTVSLSATTINPSFDAPPTAATAAAAAPVDPAADGTAAPAAAPSSANPFAELPQVTKALAKTRFTFELTLPGKILEHNATKKKGNKLSWTFDAKALAERAEKGEEAEGLRVKFTKTK